VASPLTVLTRYRDFRLLFLAQLVMFGGDWFVMIPLLGLLQRLTGGGLYGALTLAADTGLNALLLPLSGTVADRLDRRRIMVLANLAAIGAVLALFAVRSPGVAFLGPLAVGAVAVAKAFYTPAASAATPNVVDPADLSAAIAVGSSAWGTMSIVGASLGGVFASVFSPYTCFGLTAAGLATAAGLVLAVRQPLQRAAEPHTVRPGPVAAIGESLRYLRHQPRVFSLVTVKSAVGLGNGVLALYPVLAVLVHAGGLGTGLLFAVRGLGALVGPLLLRALLRPARLMIGLAVSMASYGLCYLAIASVHGLPNGLLFPVILVLIAVAHMAGGGNWAMSSAALQAEVPDGLRGRVLATDLMFATTAIATSQVLIGVLVDRVDTWLLVAGCGAATLLYSVGWRLVTLRFAAGGTGTDPDRPDPAGGAPERLDPAGGAAERPGDPQPAADQQAAPRPAGS